MRRGRNNLPAERGYKMDRSILLYVYSGTEFMLLRYGLVLSGQRNYVLKN